MSKQGWIGVDLDSTLAKYDGWKGELKIGEPILPMVQRVQRWLEEGQLVKIFTARVAEDNDRDKSEVVKAIQAWCLEHIGQELEVTNVKDYQMIVLYDDRCRQVEPNTGQIIGDEHV